MVSNAIGLSLPLSRGMESSPSDGSCPLLKELYLHITSVTENIGRHKCIGNPSDPPFQY